MPTADIELPVNLEFSVQPSRDAIVLHCKGQMTAGETSLAFRSMVTDLLHRYHRVIVDLGGIDKLDRRGLEMIVSLYAPARTTGTTLKYINLTATLSDSHSDKRQIRKLAS